MVQKLRKNLDMINLKATLGRVVEISLRKAGTVKRTTQ